MSFFGKFKTGSNQNSANATSTTAKKDPNAPQPTLLEKHIADVAGPVRPDGSDKFFGFENYGSTCYCNSIIQCLYYSAPFREHVINFPSTAFLDEIRSSQPNGAPLSPRTTPATPYPNPTSPARKSNVPASPGQGPPKPEDSRDSPEHRKRLAIQAGPVLDMTHDNSLKYGMDESLFTSLRDIFEAIIGNQSRIGVVSPHRFLEILRRENEMFRSAMHQDAHEFLNLLLNQVVDNVEMFAKQHPSLMASHANGGTKGTVDMTVSETGLNVAKGGLDTHWVHDLFKGLLTSETRCLTCENTSQRDEAFLDLSVDLSAHTSVTSCLRKFSEEEMLCERNKFHCDNCGGLQEAEKRMKIKRLPRILALHLKRFKYTEDLQRLQKLFHRVVYPFHLRLFNTTEDAEDPDRLYELYAVVVHIGGGPYHGHYVSIVKTQDRGWLLFDDELVEPVDKSYVMNFFGGEPVPGVQDAKQLACAYVLFYQETTLEAMLKEQEAEAGKPAQEMPVRTSDVETAKDGASPPNTKNGEEKLQHAPSATTPIAEEMEHMDPLVHATTSPILGGSDRSRFDPLPSQPAPPVKSKKELKQEEKARKVAKKAEEKAHDDKRHEASFKRMEAWRKQDEEMKQALEMSKQSAADEARARGDQSESKTGGLARFRHGSMSLRKKPSIFSKDKDKDKLPPVPSASTMNLNGNGTTVPAASMDGTAPATEPHEHDDVPTALPPMPAGSEPARPPGEEKVKKHRFSLGRKKSSLL
ncbi:ubiquitin carboxyl-terminal hydrolase creB like [Lecanosticta acicola]|uniref:Ubiquitin carboxyl-terminal hydrolase n=1 Tax=Lecanosticta acicola TaxID=111012 RepID=A0AAI8YZM4_9PEZI|nr:ubiquitin carboxyl-terminal hydrolase creB like [Lecanosticta acicola]